MGDVFLPGVVDLFGDPVPASRGKKGRPPHVPTPENRRFVQLSLACGHGEDAIAAALRITTKTLKRHYFHELSGKHQARMRLDMMAMGKLVEQVQAGNVAAMALFERKMERLRLREMAPVIKIAAPKASPIGKKEEQRLAAYTAGKDTSWADVLN